MVSQPKDLAYVVYPGRRLLDLVGSLSILMSLSMGGGYRPVIVDERDEILPTDTPLKLIPPKTFGDVPRPGALIVVGGDAAAVGGVNKKLRGCRPVIWRQPRSEPLSATVTTGW